MATVLAQGTVVSFDDAGSTPVTVGGVTDVTFGDGTATDIDTTSLASTAKEFRQGLQDFGDCAIELLRDPDDLGQIQMLLAKGLQSTRTVIVTYNDASTIDTATFEAYVKSLSTITTSDGVLTGTATLKISGAVVWS